MRNVVLLLGNLAVVACSLDHVVIAALDDAGGANTSDSGAGAGSAGRAVAMGGDVASGSSPAEVGGGRALITGGFTGDIRLADDAGATSELVCSCLDSPTELCGSDGVTYHPTECGDDGGPCLPPSIACWHACPCLAGESADPGASSWFSIDCDPTTKCPNNFTCMTFTNVQRDPTTCTTSN